MPHVPPLLQQLEATAQRAPVLCVDLLWTRPLRDAHVLHPLRSPHLHLSGLGLLLLRLRLWLLPLPPLLHLVASWPCVHLKRMRTQLVYMAQVKEE